MTTRLSRERASGQSRERASEPVREGATPVAPVRPHTSSTLDSGATEVAGSRATRLRERRARVSRKRRMGSAAAALVFAGLSSTTLVSSAAIANNNPAPNSVLPFDAAPTLGSAAGIALRAGVVGIAATPDGRGYWLVGADGGVFAFGSAKFYGSNGADHLNAPIVGIAATPDGRGYWLVGADGGVFAFGDASYAGSIAGATLAAPIVAMIATHDGDGYWLVGADGGIFAFGDAPYEGSAQQLQLSSPIVGATATTSGNGYWLVGADGGVFGFGDARFHGSEPDLKNPAVGIAASANGLGYWVARADGSVAGFGTRTPGNPTTTQDPQGEHAPTVAIAATGHGGYWLAQGEVDPTSALANDPFLACTRAHESSGAGGYTAVSAGGTYRGAYQFDRSTWNSAAQLAGREELVGADPATVAAGDQDLLAITLYHSRGAQPWGGRCSGLT